MVRRPAPAGSRLASMPPSGTLRALRNPGQCPMKSDIHPEYSAMKATCRCGNVIETRSTLGGEIHLDVCSKCHPFYTGRQKIVDAGGRVERFRKRFGSRGVG
jgi:large subunit ribosomal protein L31